jgi:hypothetical protein
MSTEPSNSQLPITPFPTIARLPGIFGGFTPRQSLFIDNYIGKNDPKLTGNGTRSAQFAGYKGNDTALAIAARQLLRLPKIQAEIRRRLGIAVASPGEVLETLTKHARADLTDLLDSKGNLVFSKAKSKRILKKLKTKTTRRITKDGEEIEDITHEYEIHDPQAALRDLGKFHKLFTDRVESETQLSDSDIDRIGQQLLSTMLEAASRKRSEVIEVEAITTGETDT